LHLYLRAVGFSKYKTKSDLKRLVNDILLESKDKNFIQSDRDSVIVEYNNLYSDSLGVTIRGEYDEENNLTLDFYYPYLISEQISTNTDITIERHAAKESFAGICEDIRIGVSLIFYLQNEVEYMKYVLSKPVDRGNISVNFSALSVDGKILFPIKKTEKEKAKIQKASSNRSQLIVAAKNGDESAIENLTLEDIDTYALISRRIQKEDVFSLVDTYFMPYGVECDQYSILGEIEECSIEKNRLTEEEIHILQVNCNGMSIKVCINSEDLVGEPAKGRRFKGTIWLQGKLNFPF